MRMSGAEMARITISMTVTCALGAAILGGIYIGTERYQRAAQLRTEQRAIAELLGLDSSATVTEVRQYLNPERRAVVYEAHALGGPAGTGRLLSFSLDGQLQSQQETTAEPAGNSKTLQPLGRLFVARSGGGLAGFVVEGSARGYKNRIRFLVALSPAFTVAGVRVIEHEEDPGLGAEVATRVFQGQFLARTADDLKSLEVTRDPMPEDWRVALAQLARVPVERWREAHADLLARERGRPIYAVTGATISSRALTDGVRTTVEHFRRRWELLAPYLGGTT